jgi:hypothetical protein
MGVAGKGGGTLILRDLHLSQDMAVRFLSSVGTRRRLACWWELAPKLKEFVGLDPVGDALWGL